MKSGKAPETDSATNTNKDYRDLRVAKADGRVPKVSVVVPCYNHGKYLTEALESVRAQTLSQFEIIVVDDGSTDEETREVLTGLEGTDVQLVRIPNQGPGAARNVGINSARGIYILPLDADDRIAPSYLERATLVLDRDQSVGVVYGMVEFFGDATGLWIQPDFSNTLILLENMVTASAVFRRSDWEQVGGYRTSMRTGWEDWDFWLTLVDLKRHFVRLPEIHFYYRIRHNSRDRSLSFLTKLRLMLRLILNHPLLYLRRILPALKALLIARYGSWGARTITK